LFFSRQPKDRQFAFARFIVIAFEQDAIALDIQSTKILYLAGCCRGSLGVASPPGSALFA
jgi:hypothetical protein